MQGLLKQNASKAKHVPECKQMFISAQEKFEKSMQKVHNAYQSNNLPDLVIGVVEASKAYTLLLLAANGRHDLAEQMEEYRKDASYFVHGADEYFFFPVYK